MELSATPVTTEEPIATQRTFPWLRMALVLVALALAVVPSWLVFQDRWLDDGSNRELFRESWCSVDVFCRTGLPSYFLLIFACAGAIILLLLALQPTLPLAAPAIAEPLAPAGREARGAGIALMLAALSWLAVDIGRAFSEERLPGWGWVGALLLLLAGSWFYEWDRERVLSRLRSVPAWAGAFLISLLALTGLLRSMGFDQGAVVLFGGLLAFGLYGMARWQAHPLAWIMLLGLAAYTYAIDGWWFSVIGDEYAFARLAGEIAERQSLEQIGNDLLKGLAVYGQHPYLSSVVQAITVKLFGYDNFGWRFGAPAICTLSLPLFYYVYRGFTNRPVALMATLWLAGSHYLMAFGKIGYNNLQAHFGLGLGLASALWLVRSRRLSAAVACGLSLGLCLYLYPAAFYVLPVALLLLVVCMRPLDRRAFALGAVMLAVLLLSIFPLTRQPDYWEGKRAGTLFNNPERTATPEALQTHLSNNFIYSAISFLYLGDESHFVVVGYADPLSGVLIPLGGLALALRPWRTRGHFFWAASYAGMLIMVGVSHDRTFPTPTRMYLMLPFFALFTALALFWLGEQLRSVGAGSRVLSVLGSGVLAAIILLNLWQAYPLSFERSTRYQVNQPLFLHAADAILGSDQGRSLRIHFLNDPQNLNVESLYELLDLYRVPYTVGQLVEHRLVGEQIDVVPEELWADNRAILLINPQLEAGQRQMLIERAQASGRSPCSMRTARAEERFVLWMPPGREGLCPVGSRQ
jgi:4-amino-4-deoxy-L-arabinose transferase-like glycosyltransferase